jgi:hypothetical protein
MVQPIEKSELLKRVKTAVRTLSPTAGIAIVEGRA